MGCLVELFLKKQNKEFPSNKIINNVLTVTRSQQPVYMYGSREPVTYARGRSETRLRLELFDLTDEEFHDIFKKVDKGETLGPIRIKIEDTTIEAYGVAAKVNYDGRRWENLIELEIMVEKIIHQVGSTDMRYEL
jgi:hypothetical protein